MRGPCLQSLLAPLEEDRQPAAAAAAGRVPVLLPVALDQTYDYLLPDGLEARPGAFVLVPFGPQTAHRRGLGRPRRRGAASRFPTRS